MAESMTKAQFLALAQLANIAPDTRSHRAALDYFVNGLRAVDAAKKHKICGGAFCEAIKRIKIAKKDLPVRLALIEQALGLVQTKPAQTAIHQAWFAKGAAT